MDSTILRPSGSLEKQCRATISHIRTTAHLRESSHTEEAVHGARLFVAVHGAELRPADGQFAVAVQAVLVDRDVARAVHRLQLVRLVLHSHLRAHRDGLSSHDLTRTPLWLTC